MAMHASTGDEIVIDSTEVGVPPRRGTILEVRGEPGHEHYVVRWDSGHESIFYPASTAHVVHPGTPRQPT
jgi:Domain of unknown function (DUF1918)